MGEGMGEGRARNHPGKVFPSHNPKTMVGVEEGEAWQGSLTEAGPCVIPPGAPLSLGGLTLSSPSTLTSWIDSGPSMTFGPVSGVAPSLVRPHRPLSPHPSPSLPSPEQTSGGEDKRKAALCLPCPPARAESFLTQKWRVWRGRKERED